ncbi:nucleoside phosphorylase domain-containing protein [Microdochium bolleyi]|uniref:Nucleoside phosphorylase domain-containing protein n=1 Tax=Microdochium bolleyi TaxID=196109 RepID=A0A136ISA8_9PEZI|nr:nucleoside phosphorylase domain-containing protein [Microdochium bolleyi]
MEITFPTIRHYVLVGIGGGVPTDQDRIRLGDVVIGVPKGEHPGVVQYDLGKIETTGTSSRTGSLPAPSWALLHAVSELRVNETLGQDSPIRHLSVFDDFPKFHFPGRSSDPKYVAASTSCDMRGSEATPNKSRQSDDPEVFFGTIASGNKVVKNAAARDQLSRVLGGVLCFEMEAAGVLASFPCLVVRGICDYADEYKDKEWQPYAAATAAAYAKAILCAIHNAKA